MIIFKIVRWKNFLSTGNFYTEIKLNEHSTTLIIGENGSGKSTLLDALSFALFGKAFRNINKPQLLNTITNKDLIVELEFEIGSTQYKVIRGIKPDIFQVYKNDVLMNQTSESKDYQRILESQILKMNHKSFCQVIVLGSANFQPFMQMPKANRREIIESLLDLQIFTTMNNILKQKIVNNNDNLYKISTDKKLVEQRIKLIKEHLVEIQFNNKQLIEDKKNRINETLIILKDLEDKSKLQNDQIHKLEVSIEGEQAFANKNQKLSSLRHKIEAKLSVIRKEVTFFNTNNDCPTCKQPIDTKFKAIAVHERNNEINKINEGLDLLIKEYEETNSKLQDIMNIHKTINENNMELHRINTRINSLIEYKETLEAEINKISKTLNNIDASKISDSENELEQLKLDHNKLNEEKQLLSVTATLLKDGGIKAKIIKQYIPIINKLINKYLAQMEFMCQFDLDEEFAETIKSRFRDTFSYESFSEGEKQKIDIALLFTWRAISKLRNSINTNILIFDEILDSSLDANSMDYFMIIIRSFTKGENIFIISHREQMSDKFDNLLRFKKIKNFSKLISE